MADPADSTDSAVPRRSRGAGKASSKRRASAASSVSTDTENKLARAVQSTQRLAQLSDVPRDDSTLDLFPDDPTRALVESMTIDVRQGTLSGFELPAVVQAAVEAVHGGNPVSVPGAPRRVGRAKGAAAGGGEESDGAQVEAAGAPVGERGDAAAVKDANASSAEGAADASSGDAPGAESAAAGDGCEVAVADGAAAGDAGEVSAAAGAVPAVEGTAPIIGDGASVTEAAASPAKAGTDASISPGRTAAEARAARASVARRMAAAEAVAAGEAASATQFHESPATPASRPVRPPVASSPELDRARATAFADTVDALYGVIADQRRAAADLTRRMKWMLAIVAGALLVTVGVGVTQTLLLSRLARDAAAQQQRTEQLLQTQQAALAGVLERIAAPASVPAAAVATPAAAQPVPPAHRFPNGRRAHLPMR